MLRCISKALVLACLAAPAATAQYFEDGLAAYNRGDYEVALKGLEPLANRGEARAQHYLAFMYLRGKAVKQSDTEAVAWFLRAARQGHMKAQYNVAVMYHIGLGVRQNDTEAVKWFRAAAKQGHKEAEQNLLFMRSKGRRIRTPTLPSSSASAASGLRGKFNSVKPKPAVRKTAAKKTLAKKTLAKKTVPNKVTSKRTVQGPRQKINPVKSTTVPTKTAAAKTTVTKTAVTKIVVKKPVVSKVASKPTAPNPRKTNKDVKAKPAAINIVPNIAAAAPAQQKPPKKLSTSKPILKKAPRVATKATPRPDRKAAPVQLSAAKQIPEKSPTKAKASLPAAPPKSISKQNIVAKAVPKRSKPLTTKTTPAPVIEDFHIQLGAVKLKARAAKEAGRLNQKYKGLLGPLKIIPVRSDLGKRGIFYRLRAGPLHGWTSANTLCKKLSAQKQSCIVSKP